jgi:LPS-assembly protein
VSKSKSSVCEKTLALNMILRLHQVLLPLLALFILPASLSAQKLSELEFGDTTVHITADQMEYESGMERVHFAGQVSVRTGPYQIHADSMSLDLKTKMLEAKGRVRITTMEDEQEKEIMIAQEAHIELPADQGYMLEGRMVVPWDRGEVTVWGKKLEMLDEHTFLLEAGGFTPCQCKPGKKPDWSVQARRLSADTQRAVKVKSARILIRDRTIFYVPVFSYPLGTDRRSGFLLPEFDHSSVNGYQAVLPYYQVLGPSADMTFFPGYLEKRGIKGGAEFRYNLGEAGKGQAELYGLNDIMEHEGRGAFLWQHRSIFESGFEFKSDINLASDNEYIADFDEFSGLRYARALESRLVSAYHRPDSDLTMEFSWFDDLMGDDLRNSLGFEDRDEAMIQLLPEIRYALLTRNLVGPIYADISARAQNYFREDQDLGRGIRMEFLPRLIYPGKWADAMEVWAAAGFREILYRPDPGYFRESSLSGGPETSLRVSLPLERLYQGKPGATRYRHTLEPSLIHFYQGELQEPEDPFFQALDPGEEVNLLGLNLESRLFCKPGPSAKNIFISEINRIELTQFYDIVTEDFPDLRVEIRLGPGFPPSGKDSWGQISFKLNGYYGWEEGSITRLFAEARYTDPRKDSFRIGYLDDSGEHQSHLFIFTARPARDLFADTQLIISPRIRLDYRTYYSLEHEQLTEQVASLDYLAAQRCWAVTFVLSDRLRPDRPEAPHEIKTALLFRIHGI